jgi:hypothetical protein
VAEVTVRCGNVMSCADEMSQLRQLVYIVTTTVYRVTCVRARRVAYWDLVAKCEGK